MCVRAVIDVLHRLPIRARALGLPRLFWEQMSRVPVSPLQSDDITTMGNGACYVCRRAGKCKAAEHNIMRIINTCLPEHTCVTCFSLICVILAHYYLLSALTLLQDPIYLTYTSYPHPCEVITDHTYNQHYSLIHLTKTTSQPHTITNTVTTTNI